MLSKPANTVACCVLALWPSFATAETSKKVPPLYGATKIDDAQIDSLVISLLNTYLLLREGVVIQRAASNAFESMNFYYASGPNFIVNQRLSPSALVAFDADSVEEMVDLPTNSGLATV